jgi:hypothetical protein
VIRGATGYATTFDPDTRMQEHDTTTCGHCQRVIFTKPHTASTVYLVLDRPSLTWREEAGAFCRVCMRPVCLACHAHGGCRPWEAMIERAESRERFLQSAGIRG